MDRVEWESLPTQVRGALQDALGPLTKVEPVSEGRRAAFTATAHGQGTRFFLKGALATATKGAAQLERERAIAPHVTTQEVIDRLFKWEAIVRIPASQAA